MVQREKGKNHKGKERGNVGYGRRGEVGRETRRKKG